MRAGERPLRHGGARGAFEARAAPGPDRGGRADDAAPEAPAGSGAHAGAGGGAGEGVARGGEVKGSRL